MIIARLGGVQLSITSTETPKCHQLSVKFGISSCSSEREQKPPRFQKAAGSQHGPWGGGVTAAACGCCVPPAPHHLQAEITAAPNILKDTPFHSSVRV